MMLSKRIWSEHSEGIADGMPSQSQNPPGDQSNEVFIALGAKANVKMKKKALEGRRQSRDTGGTQVLFPFVLNNQEETGLVA
jgi:hypothetical protein